MKIRTFILPVLIVCLLSLLFFSCSSKKIASKNAPQEKEKEQTTETTTRPKPAPKIEDLVELSFEPNPVQPNKVLTIKVSVNLPEDNYLVEGPLAYLTRINKITVHIPGASSASKTSLPLNEPVPGLEGTYFWYKANDKVELKSAGKNEWIVGCIAPTDESIYPAEIIIFYGKNEKKISRQDWFLKVFPEKWEEKPGAKTPEEAILNELNRSFAEDLKVRFKLENIEERNLLPDDRRDTRYLKLYMVTFTLLDNTPVLPQGSHTQFFYVLRESPEGNWKVLSSGSAP